MKKALSPRSLVQQRRINRRNECVLIGRIKRVARAVVGIDVGIDLAANQSRGET
jgi:hypothetical protein